MYSVFVSRPSQAQTPPGLVGHSRQSASGAASRLAGREGSWHTAAPLTVDCGVSRPANCWENCVVVVMEER